MSHSRKRSLVCCVVAMIALWGCGEGTTDPIDRGQDPSPTQLSVSSTGPATNATGVDVDVSVWVEFNKSTTCL